MMDRLYDVMIPDGLPTDPAESTFHSGTPEREDVTAELLVDPDLLQRERDINATLLRIGNLIAAELDTDTTVYGVVTEVMQLTQARFGAFVVPLSSTHDSARIVATIGVTPEDIWMLLSGPIAELVETAISERRVLGHFDQLWEPTAEDAARGSVVNQVSHAPSLMIVPVAARGGDQLGVLLLGHDTPSLFPEHVERVAGAVTSLAGAAIEMANQREASLATERRLSALVNGLNAIIWEADAQTGVYTFVSDAAVDILGYPIERWLTESDFRIRLVHPDDRDRVFAARGDIQHRAVSGQLEYRVVAADGRPVWMRDVYYIVPSSDGTPASMRGLMTDITARREAEEALVESEERFRSAFDDAAIPMTIVDAQTERLVRVNPPFCAMLGYSEAELLGAKLQDITFDEDIDLKRTVLDGLRSGQHRTFTFESRCRCKDGSSTWGLIHASIVLGRDGAPLHVLAQIQDISRRRELEARLVHQAFHDDLTGLPNRTMLLDRLRQALAGSRRTRLPVALLFFDLDNFKVINDSLGHAIGDDLLVQVARRVEMVVRRQDTVARFGGDELAVLLPSIDGHDAAVEVAQRLLDVFAMPFSIQDRPTFVTASIGIAISRDGSEDPNDLLRWADIAMYRAKIAGRNRFDIFDPNVDAAAIERLDLEHDLRQAIDQNQLVLYFQPKISLSDGRIETIEALVRWRHPDRGVIPPSDFIPLAEESGLIAPLGEWVLREACRHARDWSDGVAGIEPPGVCVNVSGRQLREPDLVERITMILGECGLEPGRLVIEITESVMMHDVELTVQTLERLTNAGVQLAIDDFGMAYSSLSRLTRFPLDELKIDRHFVAELGVDYQGTAMVTGMIGLGHALGMHVVAEGVETPSQLTRLRELGCDAGQGYYFAQPLPPEDLLDLLRRSREARGRNWWR